MKTISIPSKADKKFARADRGELFGNIWMTKNIDLDAEEGKIRLSEQVNLDYSDADDADFEVPVKFLISDADGTRRWWALCQRDASSTSTGVMFKGQGGTQANGGWIQDAIASSPTSCIDDMEVFGRESGDERLIVARSTTLAALINQAWVSSWWVSTLSGPSLTSGKPHQLHKFLNLLLVPDGNLLHTVDDSLVVSSSRITLPANFEIRWIEDDGRFVYLGTKDLNGGEGYVFPWNGTSSTYEEPIPVHDKLSWCGKAKNKIMHVMNGKGQFMRNNGNAFEVISELPVANSPYRWESNSLNVEKEMHPNGIDIIDGKFHMLLMAGMADSYSNGSESRIMGNMRGGIWVHDDKEGLNLKYTLPSQTTNDCGNSILDRVGAIQATNPSEGRFLAGAQPYIDNATTEKACLYSSKGPSTASHVGYFITTLLESSAARAFFARLQLFTKALENSTDKVVVKYRLLKKKALEDDLDNSIYAITWVNTTSFTTTDADFANATVGDEVEILSGLGAGRSFHITAISLVSTTYTVTIDEANTGATTTTGVVRVSNFTKMSTFSGTNAMKKVMRISKLSKWIQFKVELRGTETSPELEEFMVEYSPRLR